MDDRVVNIEFVDQHYLGDESVTLLYTHELKNGMVVVLAEPENKVDVESVSFLRLNTARYYTALKTNRWCQVTKFEAMRTNNSTYTFIGEYVDGTQFARTYARNTVWMVKKESIMAVKAVEAAKKAYEDLKKEPFDWRREATKIVKMTEEEYEDFILKGPQYKSNNEGSTDPDEVPPTVESIHAEDPAGPPPFLDTQN